MRLQAGQAAYQEKRYSEAIDQFRVAAFGYLDQPPLLSESLVRLALAEDASGKSTDADSTLTRFLEVERRFGVYPQANLEPEIRAEFRALLQRRLSEATLLTVPSLAGLVTTEEQRIAKLPATDRRKALEAAAKREPGAARWPVALARDAMDRGDAKDAQRWASKALAVEATNTDALALRARARVALGEYADASKDLAALSTAEFERSPDLYAEKFVCLVEGKDWVAAEQVVKLVPAKLVARPDVARAQQKLVAEEQHRSGQAAGVASASKPTAPADKAPLPPNAAPWSAQKKASGPPPSDVAARSQAVLSESRRMLSAGKAGEAEKTLTEALKADPGNRALRLALLEAACLARSYEKGAAQIPAVAPFAETEAPSMFYAAVVLYETGKTAEARVYMERVLPKVSGPLVDEYSKKIIGQP